MADQADNLRQLVRAHREWRASAPATPAPTAPVAGPAVGPLAWGPARDNASLPAGRPLHRLLRWAIGRRSRSAV